MGTRDWIQKREREREIGHRDWMRAKRRSIRSLVFRAGTQGLSQARRSGDLILNLRVWGGAPSCLCQGSDLVAETRTGLSWQGAGNS